MLSAQQRIRMLECPSGKVDMVLDTDAYNEIDDQFAISYALHANEKLCVKALYAAPFDNTLSSCPADGMERSYQEIKKLLKLSNIQTDVLRGSEVFLADEKTYVYSEAAADLCRRAMSYSPDSPLYVVSIAALTNVASALIMNPAIADRIVVVWLGGNSLEWHDNFEFNIQQDVAAARVVFNSGAPLVLLPCMGVVSAFTTTEHELMHWIGGKNELCDYLVRHTIEAAEKYAKGRVWSRVIWDVTAIGWLLNDKNQFMFDKLIHTPIPEYDHHYSFDARRPMCKIVYHIHRDALFSDLFSHITA